MKHFNGIHYLATYGVKITLESSQNTVSIEVYFYFHGQHIEIRHVSTPIAL